MGLGRYQPTRPLAVPETQGRPSCVQKCPPLFNFPPLSSPSSGLWVAEPPPALCSTLRSDRYFTLCYVLFTSPPPPARHGSPGQQQGPVHSLHIGGDNKHRIEWKSHCAHQLRGCRGSGPGAILRLLPFGASGSPGLGVLQVGLSVNPRPRPLRRMEPRAGSALSSLTARHARCCSRLWTLFYRDPGGPYQRENSRCTKLGEIMLFSLFSKLSAIWFYCPHKNL